VVAVGGGHGLAATLRAARHYAGELTAVVSVADDGGSSGRLRRQLDIMPPGDLRKCLVALSEDGSALAAAFEQRFEADHTRDVIARQALNEAVIGEYRRRIGIAGEVDAVDLSALFDEVVSPIYIDMVHLSEAGNLAVAEAIVPSLATLLDTAG